MTTINLTARGYSIARSHSLDEIYKGLIETMARLGGKYCDVTLYLPSSTLDLINQELPDAAKYQPDEKLLFWGYPAELDDMMIAGEWYWRAGA